MKNLLKILAGGFVLFQVLAIAQEWDYFATAWFGLVEEPEALSEEERQEAAGAVYLTLSLMRHLYASGGDPRFADRMPASQAVLAEMLSDVEYLERNRRRQDPVLEHLEVLAVDELAPGRVEVRTRERWAVRVLWAEGGTDAEPPRSQLVHGKYLVARRGEEWQVEGWDLTGAPEPEPAAGGGEPSG